MRPHSRTLPVLFGAPASRMAAPILVAVGLILVGPCPEMLFSEARGSGPLLQVLQAQEVTAGPRLDSTRDPVSLGEAVRLLHENNPEMELGRARVRAAAGDARQAGAFANPSVDATHESLSGQGADVSETYLTLTQQFEWPGRRTARRRVGKRTHDAARASFRADSARLVHEVRRAYLEAAASAGRLNALEEVAAVFRRSGERAEIRFADGDVSRYERDRIRLERLRYERALVAAEIETDATRRALGALILPEGGGAVATLGLPEALPPEIDDGISVPKAVERHPTVVAARSTAEAARAEVDLATSLRYPDPAVTGGFKTQSNDFDGLFLGISMPVPILDRKGGRMTAAEGLADAEESRLAQARRSARRELEAAVSRYRAVRSRADLFTDGPTGGDGGLLDVAQVAYDEGEMDLIELMDAARAHRDAGMLAAEIRSEVWISYYEVVRTSGEVFAAPGTGEVNP